MFKLPRLLIGPLLIFALWFPLRGSAAAIGKQQDAGQVRSQASKEYVKAASSSGLLVEETPTTHVFAGRLTTAFIPWLKSNGFEPANQVDDYVLHSRTSASAGVIPSFYRCLLYPFHEFL
ncbi:hypothetical protein C8P68_101840 [Mucilaginibacter yixingensis]|uniref:Uncharacterized protein n=1 Tax=Mucilaginibacter yixingensis TaxID=1295612 RepID=A0A2T5JGT4_9SPHI|nr:hypothetical protein [Mucilaginibacter yixingensis]PTR01604.1 hypothetical protein C8P68_101840 [Mucilaginibacter yixingensis]